MNIHPILKNESQLKQTNQTVGCPCGYTFEVLLATKSTSLGPKNICICEDDQGKKCGRPLRDHPHEQQIQASGKLI